MPSQLKIKPNYAADGRSFWFTLPEPQYLAIIINGDWLRPLFVFGDPPEEPAPDPTDPAVLTIQTSDNFKTLKSRERLADYRVIYFAPGYHDIGLFFPIFSDQTIYIPGDAYVAGTLLGINRSKATNNAYGTKLITQDKKIFNYAAFRHGYRNAAEYVYMDRSNQGSQEFLGAIENFTIRGRGILSGEKMDWFKGQDDVPSYIILVDRIRKKRCAGGADLHRQTLSFGELFRLPRTAVQRENVVWLPRQYRCLAMGNGASQLLQYRAGRRYLH